MKQKNILITAGVLVLLVGAWGAGQLLKSRAENQPELAARHAAEARATDIALEKLIQGRWHGASEDLSLLPDGVLRSEISLDLDGDSEGISYSYRLTYVATGQWSVTGEQLVQDITNVTDIEVLDIKVSVTGDLEGEKEFLVETFRESLPTGVAAGIRDELEGSTFANAVSLTDADSFVLTLESGPQEYTRVQ
jgi:hypothetical protein